MTSRAVPEDSLALSARILIISTRRTWTRITTSRLGLIPGGPSAEARPPRKALASVLGSHVCVFVSSASPVEHFNHLLWHGILPSQTPNPRSKATSLMPQALNPQKPLSNRSRNPGILKAADQSSQGGHVGVEEGHFGP